MAINVICRGCHARFKVSDQFAGKKGPCPKCKALIEVPAADAQIVIHEPEHSEVGARGTSGKLVLKPIERQEAVIQPMLVAAFAGGALLLLLVALVLRGLEDKSVVLAVGAIVLAPPLAWAGYNLFRHEEELEPITGMELWIRTALCSVGYAVLWWAFSFVYDRFFGTAPAEVWHVAVLAPPFLFLGAGIAYCSFDLELGSGFFHYALYLFVTITLRLVMGLPPVGPAESAPEPITPALSMAVQLLASFV